MNNWWRKVDAIKRLNSGFMYTFVHLSAVTWTFAVFCLSTFYTRPRHFIPSNVEVRYTTLYQWIRIIESVFINSGRLNSLVFSQYSRGTPRLLIDYYFFGLKTNLVSKNNSVAWKGQHLLDCLPTQWHSHVRIYFNITITTNLRLVNMEWRLFAISQNIYTV